MGRIGLCRHDQVATMLGHAEDGGHGIHRQSEEQPGEDPGTRIDTAGPLTWGTLMPGTVDRGGRLRDGDTVFRVGMHDWSGCGMVG